MYWWHLAALGTKLGVTRRYGLITTNSIRQSYSRPVLDAHLYGRNNLKFSFVIPDHPWVDASDGADVRVAMTVVSRPVDSPTATYAAVSHEDETGIDLSTKVVESISSSLRPEIGFIDLSHLLSNHRLCFQGIVPAGSGFKLNDADLQPLGIQTSTMPPTIRPYIIGRDIVQRHQPKFIIDFLGLSEEEAKTSFPAAYQRILDTVYPERQHNKRTSYREKWWIFAEPRAALRAAIDTLPRFIGTPYTLKFRPFTFIPGDTLPDAMAYAIASSDASVLGVLSSSTHELFAMTTGGRLGVGNDSRYTSKATFYPFPFPDPDDENRQRIRDLGEHLDAHRKRQQDLHPDLTLTGMYNVLEKLRRRTAFTPKDRAIHDAGLLSILKQIHDDLDAAVLNAYGWSDLATDTPLADRLARGDETLEETLLERLVALNHERGDEEKKGLIRYLRPDFQNPTGTQSTQTEMEGPTPVGPRATSGAATPKKQPWPKTLPEQTVAIRDLLAALSAPATPADIAKHFTRANKKRITEILEPLTTLGQASANAARSEYRSV